MCKVIAIGNIKGGVAKTTTAASLAYGLVKRGRKVLVIDADPNGSLTAMFGLKDECEEDNTFSVLKRIIKREEVDSSYAIREVNGVHILPADMELQMLDTILPTIGKENVMKRYITNIRNDYDYILMDCQPCINSLVINCMTAAERLIIPVKADMLTYSGTENFFDLLNEIVDPVDGTNRSLRIDGILLTIAKRNTKAFKKFREFLKEQAEGIRIFDTVIPDSVKGAEIAASGKSIFELDKNCSVAAAYRQLTEDVLHIGGDCDE